MTTYSRFGQIKWDKTTVRPTAAESKAEAPVSVATRMAELLARTGVPRHPDKEHVCAQVETEFLLQAAAEVEHQFVVQYLYAMYSLDHGATGSAGDLVAMAAPLLKNTALDEMGHLLTVQNALLCIKAAPYLDRSSTFRLSAESTPLKLEPFSKEFIGRFLVAESPENANIPDELKQLSQMTEHVGALYMILYWLFQVNDNPVGRWPLPTDGSLPLGRHLLLTDYEDPAALKNRINRSDIWPTSGTMLLLPDNPLDSPADIAAAVRDALAQVASQGEGPVKTPTPGAPPVDSHFKRLSDIYGKIKDLEAKGTALAVFQAPIDPTVDSSGQSNAITEPSALALAAALNLRYAILLQMLTIAVFTDNTAQVDGISVVSTLASGAIFQEMQGVIHRIAAKLPTLARTTGVPVSTAAAGAPFLPPDPPLPSDGRARWDNLINLLGKYKVVADDAASAAPPLLPDVVQAIQNALINDQARLSFAQHVRAQLFP